MLRPNWRPFFACLSSLLLSVSLAPPDFAKSAKAAAPANASRLGSVRTVNQAEVAIAGKLLLVTRPNVRCASETRGDVNSRGTSKVAVPQNHMLMLDLSPYAIQHPECLSKIHADGIDALRISCFSLEDESKADKVLSYISNFKDLEYLRLEKTDVTDRGLEKLQGNPNLRYLDTLSCFAVTGSSLKVLSTLPNLSTVNLSLCPVTRNFLIYLPKFKSLQALGIDGKDWQKEDFQTIGRCLELQFLEIIGASRLDDQALTQLLSLKKLGHLCILGSSVTADGIKKLAALPELKNLELPRHFPAGELVAIQKALPRVVLFAPQQGARPASEFHKAIFSPMPK